MILLKVQWAIAVFALGSFLICAYIESGSRKPTRYVKVVGNMSLATLALTAASAALVIKGIVT